MSILVSELADLGFVRETLIFKTWNFKLLIDIRTGLFKVSYPMYSFFENSGGKLLEQEAIVFQFLMQKCLIQFL